MKGISCCVIGVHHGPSTAIADRPVFNCYLAGKELGIILSAMLGLVFGIRVCVCVCAFLLGMGLGAQLPGHGV